jgi:hypothetical protein
VVRYLDISLSLGNPIESIQCIIQTTTTGSSLVAEANLGVPSAPQYDSASDSIYILYTNGTAQCNSTANWGARIDFICPDPGQPV